MTVLLDPSGTVRRRPLAPHQLTDETTPTALVPVLAHFGIARIDAAGWVLSIEGLVRQPARLSLADLRRLKRRDLRAVFCCAGNPLEPTVPTRRVANVVWSGFALADVLALAGGVFPEACFVWSSGADGGSFGGHSTAAYLKDLPLERVAAGDVLLADAINGEPLPAEHGYPLRLVVPGWYGTNSVKWLSRIVLADRRADGPFTSVFYTDPDPASPSGRRPVWNLAPEAVIVSPAPHAMLVAGHTVRIEGWAWAGSGVDSVQVSTNAGRSWTTADLAPETGRWMWRRFDFAWQPMAPDPAELRCRAVDRAGATQPDSGARNAIQRVPVAIVAPPTGAAIRPTAAGNSPPFP